MKGYSTTLILFKVDIYERNFSGLHRYSNVKNGVTTDYGFHAFHVMQQNIIGIANNEKGL